jgi:hypothetical protein
MADKGYATRRIVGRPGWYAVYDREGVLRAFAERQRSWWCFYTASASGLAQGAPVRYERLRDGAATYTKGIHDG